MLEGYILPSSSPPLIQLQTVPTNFSGTVPETHPLSLVQAALDMGAVLVEPTPQTASPAKDTVCNPFAGGVESYLKTGGHLI
jgi:hypothetical protein